LHTEILKWPNGSRAAVSLTHDLSWDLNDRPLTLRTAVPDDWPAAEVRQGDRVILAPAYSSAEGRFVEDEAAPNSESATLTRTGA